MNLCRSHGYSLVEITAVAVLIGILLGGVMLMTTSTQQQSMTARTQTDLESINAAKKLWLLDNQASGIAFPTAESDRFTTLLPYLQATRTLQSISNLEPAGVTYNINAINVSAGVTNSP
jgi:type II secretory pathway pseudopilin PulG